MAGERAGAAALRARQAGERAKQAGERAAQLRERLPELPMHHVPSAWTFESAQAVHDRSVMLAAAARRSAVLAYTRAADAHRSAADVAQSLGRLVRAQEHRDLADADDLSAAALSRARARDARDAGEAGEAGEAGGWS